MMSMAASECPVMNRAAAIASAHDSLHGLPAYFESLERKTLNNAEEAMALHTTIYTACLHTFKDLKPKIEAMASARESFCEA